MDVVRDICGVCPLKFRCSYRTVVTLFTLNLVFLGVTLLVSYDFSQSYPQYRGRDRYQQAYDRWRNIREDFESYNKARQSELKKLKLKGLQMDAVVGFDYFQKENAKPERVVPTLASIRVAGPINFIPVVPKMSDSDIISYLTDNITRQFLKLPKKIYKKKVVILSPICDVASQLDKFAVQLQRLSYPHKLISVYFGEDSSADRTLDMATLIADELETKHNFSAARAFHFNISGGVHGSWGDIHHRASQFERRSHIAKARNTLLDVALKLEDPDYVLWIDSDISELPIDLIQQLMFAKSDVVTASCLFKSGQFKRVYDKNSWRETALSLEDQKLLPNDVLLVEGYTYTNRIYLPDLRAEGRVVPLDGVGGCALLIRAKCHKQGLKFPEELYKNHIETEGLAKMAKAKGFKVVGMPFVEVFH